MNKATLLSGVAVAFDLRPRCSMENTVMPLHCSFVCIYLPVLPRVADVFSTGFSVGLCCNQLREPAVQLLGICVA